MALVKGLTDAEKAAKKEADAKVSSLSVRRNISCDAYRAAVRGELAEYWVKLHNLYSSRTFALKTHGQSDASLRAFGWARRMQQLFDVWISQSGKRNSAHPLVKGMIASCRPEADKSVLGIDGT